MGHCEQRGHVAVRQERLGRLQAARQERLGRLQAARQKPLGRLQAAESMVQSQQVQSQEAVDRKQNINYDVDIHLRIMHTLMQFNLYICISE